MNQKQKLIQLRQENCGYNVEKAEDQGTVDQVDNFTLFITDEETNHVMVFYKEETIKNEIDFIEQYPPEDMELFLIMNFIYKVSNQIA